MKACLLGSIGVIVETSRLQRLAYNAAFEELGLDVYWNVATYCKLLEVPGGLRRLESVFGSEWPVGMADEVYALKQKHFEDLASRGLQLRPGVADAFRFCRQHGIALAWVTTTTPAMLDTLVRHTEGLAYENFDLICSKQDAPAEKPDPSIYGYALQRLGVDAENAVAVEDTPVNQTAALAADLQCYLFPGEYALAENNVLVTRNLPSKLAQVHDLWSARIEDGAQALAGV